MGGIVASIAFFVHVRIQMVSVISACAHTAIPFVDLRGTEAFQTKPVQKQE